MIKHPKHRRRKPAVLSFCHTLKCLVPCEGNLQITLSRAKRDIGLALAVKITSAARKKIKAFGKGERRVRRRRIEERVLAFHPDKPTRSGGGQKHGELC